MDTLKLLLLTLSLTFAITLQGDALSPSWQFLECEEGHKYLFSEDTRTWEEARAECQLYGGWLLDISSMEEQYCLMEFAQNFQLFHWWWHDGNDVEYEGVYVHADGSHLTWLSPKWVGDSKELGFIGDYNDALLFGTFRDFRAGAWFEAVTSWSHNYICESLV